MPRQGWTEATRCSAFGAKRRSEHARASPGGRPAGGMRREIKIGAHGAPRVVPCWHAEEVRDEAKALTSAEEEGRATGIEPLRRRSGVRRYPRAELLRRAFEVEVLMCPHCGSARRLPAAITSPESIERRQSAPRQAGRVGAAGRGARAVARGAGEGAGTGSSSGCGTSWWLGSGGPDRSLNRLHLVGGPESGVSTAVRAPSTERSPRAPRPLGSGAAAGGSRVP